MITCLRIAGLAVLLSSFPGTARALSRLAPLSPVHLQPTTPQEPRPDSSARDTTRRRPAGRPSVNVSGYVQVFYKGRREVSGDGLTEPGVFRVQRVRLEFKGNVARHVGYDVEIDPRAPDITGLLRDGFITLDYLPHHEIRVGQQKTLFGYENPTSSSRLFTVNRAEVSDNLSRGVNLRDIGLGLTGSIRLSDRVRIEDAITLVNGSGLNVQADGTHRKNVWGRIGARYRNGGLTLRLGLSGASGDDIVPGDSGPPAVPSYRYTFTRWGADVVIDHPWAFLAAEYVVGNDQAPASVPGVGGQRSSGWYVLLAAKTRWRAGPLVRYDALEDYWRWTLGGYVGLPADPVSLLLNYEIIHDGLGRHDDRYYARLQVRF